MMCDGPEDKSVPGLHGTLQVRCAMTPCAVPACRAPHVLSRPRRESARKLQLLQRWECGRGFRYMVRRLQLERTALRIFAVLPIHLLR
jgi:hypothetical protein